MKTALARSLNCLGEAPSSESSPDLRVQIIYEDREAGLRAKQTVDCLEEQLGATAKLWLNLWRFDLLSEPTIREEVANDAVRADLVLLSAHGKHGLPEDVSKWIREWLCHYADEPPALAVLLDASAKGGPLAASLLASLRHAAEPRRVPVFYNLWEPEPPMQESTAEDLRFRAETTTAVLAEMLSRSRALQSRHIGLNE